MGAVVAAARAVRGAVVPADLLPRSLRARAAVCRVRRVPVGRVRGDGARPGCRRLGSGAGPGDGAGVRGAVGPGPDGPGHRGVPQRRRDRAAVPHRARRDRRRDGRVRLRGVVWPWFRGGRGCPVLHGRVRGNAGGGAAGFLRPRALERPVRPRALLGARRDGDRAGGVPPRAGAGPRTPPGRRRDRRARGARPLPVELATPDVRADAADRGGRVADPAPGSGGQGIAPAVVRGDGAAPGTSAGAALARRRAGGRGRRRGTDRDGVRNPAIAEAAARGGLGHAASGRRAGGQAARAAPTGADRPRDDRLTRRDDR